MAERHGWRIDRCVNLGTVFAVLSSMVLLVGVATSVQARLNAVEDKMCTVETRVDESRATALQVARIEERVLNIQKMLVDIRTELRQGRNS